MTSPAHATDAGDATTDDLSSVTAATSPVLGADAARAAGPDAMASVTEAPAAEKSTEFAEGGYVGAPSVATYRDGDGRVHYASPYSKATRQNVAAGDWTEVDPDEPPFDPTQHLVREVVAYLNEHAHEPEEIARVLAAEAEGEDRPSIRNWPPAT